MNNQIQSIGSVLLEEYMKGYNVGFSDGTKEGKADAMTDLLDKVAEKLKSKPYWDDEHNFQAIPIDYIDEVIEELKAIVNKED